MSRIVEKEFKEDAFNLFHSIDEDFSMDFHCHNFIEVYLSISGGKRFIIGDRIYEIEHGDLFVNNDLEIHRVIAQQGVPYERYFWEFKPSFAWRFSTEQTDLLHYVYRRPPDFSHRVSLAPSQLNDLLSLTRKYEALEEQRKRNAYGSDLRRDIVCMEMLLFFAEAYRHPGANRQDPPPAKNDAVVSGLLRYINKNITKDLTLDVLAAQIGVSKYHMCKVFKSRTGTTINRYVIACRIGRAKELLSSGQTVTDACFDSGFQDLSHFIRTFHTHVGVSPTRYVRELQDAGQEFRTFF